MKEFNEKEKTYMSVLINNELKDYLSSGEELTDDYVVSLRSVLQKLGLDEIYPFDDWYGEE